jgi:hypothetical protein
MGRGNGMNRDAIDADELTYRYGELTAVDQIGFRVAEGVAFIHRGRIVALDTPHNLKPQYGKRALRAEVVDADGRLEHREIVLDQAETPEAF